MFERKTRKNPGRRAADNIPVPAYVHYPRGDSTPLPPSMEILLVGVWLGVALAVFYLRGDQ